MNQLHFLTSQAWSILNWNFDSHKTTKLQTTGNEYRSDNCSYVPACLTLFVIVTGQPSINELPPGIVVFHSLKLSGVWCRWCLSVSVRPYLCPSLCPSLSVSVRPSVICSSLCSHVLRSLSLSHVLADPVVHWNLSYNLLPLLSHSSLLSQNLLVADKFCCVHVCDCFWVSVYRRPDGTFGQATWRCLYKQRSHYFMVTSHCAQTSSPADQRPGRPRLASLIIIDRCQQTSYRVDL